MRSTFTGVTFSPGRGLDVWTRGRRVKKRKPCLTTGVPSTARGVCPLCHSETKPGEQLYEDGSCWPQCLSAR